VRRIVPVVWLLASSACNDSAVSIEYYGASDYAFSRAERRVIQDVAESTALEVRRFLPALPTTLTLQVRPGDDVIEETGETATAIPPNTVHWTVDPKRHGGVQAIAGQQLRATLFHEFHHLVRDAMVPSRSLIDRAVTEGMATAFERDFARADTPWGRYPDEVSSWVSELMALPSDAPREAWMFRHPDGRRWIAFRVGTYLVDRASRASGKTPADLVSTSTEAVLELAGARR
jgi:hypothetical protein